MTEPAVSADDFKDSPVAAAKDIVPAWAATISSAVKPSLAYSSCNWATWVAVNIVVDPSFSAESLNFLNSASVAPDIALTADIWASKSEKDVITPLMLPIIALNAKADAIAILADLKIPTILLPVVLRAFAELLALDIDFPVLSIAVVIVPSFFDVAA